MKSKRMHRNLIKIGGVLALVGLVIFLSFYVIKPYGSSSPGMAALPVVFAMLAGLGLFVIGLLMVVLSFFFETIPTLHATIR